LLFGFLGKKTLASVTVGPGAIGGVISTGLNSSSSCCSVSGDFVAVVLGLFENAEMAEIAEKVLKMLLREVVVVEAVELRSGPLAANGGGAAAGATAVEVRFENIISR